MNFPRPILKAIGTIGVILLGAAACQTEGTRAPVVSLEEAKKVVAEFSGSFTPPPRSVNDILSLFDETEMTDELCYLQAGPTKDEVSNVVEKMTSSFWGGDWDQISDDKIIGARQAKYLMEIAWEEFLLGDYSTSIKYVKEAENRTPWVSSGREYLYRALGAFLQAYAGDFDSAESSLGYLPAIQTRRKDVLTLYRFYSLASEAAIEAAQGNLIEAEALYKQALDLDDPLERALFSEQFGLAKLALAEVIMLDGRLVEAENLIREELKTWAPDTTPMVAASLLRFGQVIYEQGRFEEAEKISRLLVRLFAPICAKQENLLKAQAHHLLAKSLIARERWQEATAQYDAIRENMSKDPETFNRLFGGDIYRALAMLKVGRISEAHAGLRDSLGRVQKRLGADHYRVGEIRGFLAMVLLAEGSREEALREFAEATEILLKRSRDADDESNTLKARDHRFNLILEAYMKMLADMRRTGRVKINGRPPASEAFRLAGVALSRGVQRALAASSVRTAFKDPGLSDLARQEQDTRKRITAVYGTLARELSRTLEEQSPGRIDTLEAMVFKLRAARAALLVEIEARFPEYANLINPKVMTLEETQTLLRPDEAMITTFVGADRTYVWAIPHIGKAAFAVVNMGREELAETVGLLRQALEPNARVLGDIPPFDLARAYGLYERLLMPVEEGWKGAKNLLVIAHGPLGYLPLSVLPTKPMELPPEQNLLFTNYRDVPWLAREHTVTVLPSVVSLRMLRSLSRGQPKRRAFVGFGDPWFSAKQAAEAGIERRQERQVAALDSQGVQTRNLQMHLRAAPQTRAVDSAELAVLPRLPDTANEIMSIARVMQADPTTSVFLGKEASEDRVKTMDLSGVRVISFATHGLVPGDLNGLLQPALAFSSPQVTGGEEDGLLTMGEILGLKLNADWVVLSACNTAASGGEGAEAVSGLGQAFFYAGTRALLVSNWPVHSAATTALMTSLFRLQTEDPALIRAEALRRAMMGLIDGSVYVDAKTGKTVFSYAHPLFWAPFSLIGDGGGGGTQPGA